MRSGAAAGRQRRRGHPATAASGSLLEAWNNITSFNEDLSRIDRARDALESEVARTPSLDALLLLAWAHLLWADYRAPDVSAKLASYERGRDVAKRAIDMAPRSRGGASLVRRQSWPLGGHEG